MSVHTELVPLRWSAQNLRQLFSRYNPYEDLMMVKDKSFEKPEEFIEETKRIIHLIKYQDDIGFYDKIVTSFAFVFQKIDCLYLEKSQELQSQDLDDKKEKEIKSILKDLLKCELEIENICGYVAEYRPVLYSLLETLFDDEELLNLLLLLISKRVRLGGQDSDLEESLDLKCFHFVSPLLKLFYSGKGDVLDPNFWTKSNAAEEAQKNIVDLLGKYTDLNEDEISRFCEKVKCKDSRQIVMKEKRRFKEEKGYYELLGNLSIISHLWKQEFQPLLRIGVVCFMFLVDGWQTLETGIKNKEFERYWQFKELSLKYEYNMPIKMLEYCLNKRDLDGKDLQLLELSFSAFRCLVTSNLSTIEEFVNDCLLVPKGSKSFLLHECLEFLDSKILVLNKMQSNYLIASSLSENLVSGWLSFFKGVEFWNFLETDLDETWQLQKKYFSPFKILLNDLMKFISLEKREFLSLPASLQSKLLCSCELLCRNPNVLEKSDLEKLFVCVQEIGIGFLQNAKIDIFRFRALLQLFEVLLTQTEILFTDRSWGENFIKEIYESKLVEEFILTYEKNPSFLQTTGEDLSIIEAICELFSFLTSFSKRYSGFVANKRNLDFLKVVLQDFFEIDLRKVSSRCYEAFCSGVATLFKYPEFPKHLKEDKEEEKFFFGILRLHIFHPVQKGSQSRGFGKEYYEAVSEKKRFLQKFGKLLEICERKMRDPSLNFYDMLKKLQNEIGDQHQAIGFSPSIVIDREASIINERTSLNSLINFARAFCQRISSFVREIPQAFELDLKEEIALLITRFARMSLDPLIVFVCSQDPLITLDLGFRELYHRNQELMISVLEGILAGVVDICKKFKFHEYSVISKLDAKRLSKMVTKIAAVHYLRKEDIPEDITYQEAALMSLLIGLVCFNKRNRSKNPLKKIERLEGQFKEAAVLINQVKNNILKCLSLEIAKDFTIEESNLLEGKNFHLNLWNEIFNVFNRVENLKPTVEETYREIFQRFDYDQVEEKPGLAGIIYNTLRLKEFHSDENDPFIFGSRVKDVQKNLWLSMVTSTEGLKSLLWCELYLLGRANQYCDSKEDCVVSLANVLEACFKKNDLAEKKEFKDEKILFETIADFLKKLAESEIPKRNCKILMKKNLDAVFGFFENVYRSYSKYAKNNIEMIESYRIEIQRYINAVRDCQHHHFVNMKELFILGEEFNAIAIGYWASLYQRNYDNLEVYIRDISKEPSQSIDQIYQLDFLNRCLEQFFMKEIVNELKLSRDMIEGLLMATKRILKNLTSENLRNFAKEKQGLDFPDILSGFISLISKLAINCGVSDGQLDDDLCLGLTESIFYAQNAVLQGMRRDIFSGAKSCFQALVCLMNTILRANKVFRAEFMKRGFLKKLLTVERLSSFKADEITSVLFIMTTLLEDGFVAEECLQTFIKSLIENYAFERESIASLAKAQERQESRRIKQLSKSGILPRGYLLVEQKIEQEDETYDEPHVYLNEDLEREMVVKDTSALVVVLSGILSNYPRLIPEVLQEAPLEDTLKSDPEITHFFKSNPRWSVYDTLLRLILLKDGNSAVFLIASLIQEPTELRYILLFKTFEILKDILACEETQGTAAKTLNSVLMRRNIGIIIGFISNQFNLNANFLYKEETLQLIKEITQKLLYNPQMIAYSMQSEEERDNSTRSQNGQSIHSSSTSMIQILSETVKQNTLSKTMPAEEIKRKYAQILKVLKTRTPEKEPKAFLQLDLILKKEIPLEICRKEEPKRVLEIGGLKEKESVGVVRLAAHGESILGAKIKLSTVFKENTSGMCLENLYKSTTSNEKLGYMLEKLKESGVLGQCQKENQQNFGDYIDSKVFLPLLRADLSRPIENPEENENCASDKEEEKESRFKYFVDGAVKSENHFKFRVNRALQKSKRLKEMICLERNLEGPSGERNEKIIKEFTSALTEFDKNVVYASLGKKFEAGLSEELRKVMREIRKEFLAIQEDFSQYEVSKPFEANQEEEDSQYDDLDYDFQFLSVDDDDEESDKEEDHSEDDNEDEISLDKFPSCFEVDDSFVMNVLELFFCCFNPVSKSESMIMIMEFLRDSLSLDPANELKVIDTMITILYTPEFFEYHFKGSYEEAVPKILNYFAKYYQETTRTYIFFVPKTYLDNFGNQVLKNVKEATKFAQKTSECQTVLDMMLNLIEMPNFYQKDRWIAKIIEGLGSLMAKEKGIKLGESPGNYEKIVSSKGLLKLLSLIEKPVSAQLSLMVQELYMNLTQMPELFVSFHDDFSKHLSQTIVNMNRADLSLGHCKLVLTMILSYAAVFHKNLFTTKGEKIPKLEKLLQKVARSFFREEQVKTFFLNIHELLKNIEQQEDFKALLNLLIMICIAHYSIIIMERSIEEESGNFGKQAGDSDEMMPSDFEEIFANFALRHCSQISLLVTSGKTKMMTILRDLVSITNPKLPCALDLKGKIELFKAKLCEYRETNGGSPEDEVRQIKVNRENLVFSAMKAFKEDSKEDLLQKSIVHFRNETGADGGGLKRDFYEQISKQLFDPCVGLFKLAENQTLIQPNPLSGIVPYDSTLMQFAGIILAKGISEGAVMDVHFTKSFLKYLLGRRIAIGDMEEIDADLGKNLKWILENNIEDLYLTYTHEIEVLGERKIIEIKEGGSDIFVDEENKKEYVRQICEYRMRKQIKKQLDEFLKGFRTVLPEDLLSHFSVSEFEILIAGESKIDLEEMKKHVVFDRYSESDQIIQWFWEVLDGFSQDQLKAFYYFISGSTRVPFGGFKEYPITIMKSADKNALPVAHTCGYIIELPDYESKDELQKKLLISVFDGAGGFQIV